MARLLFDQNLSFRLVDALSGRFPDCVHVRDLGLASADDRTVWKYARQHGLTIVTKDSDFNQASFLLGVPPKVVWLRIGNCTTDLVIELLLGRADEIENFVDASDDVVLIVGE